MTYPASRIILGTAQMGTEYGIANKEGKVSFDEASCILDTAKKEGIDTLDTAYDYGVSEELIGKLTSGPDGFHIISKAPECNPDEISGYLEETLNRLGQKKIHGYLIHKFDSLKKDRSLWNAFEELKERNLTERIGASLYHAEELEFIMQEEIKVDFIQAPYNIFDQRFNDCFAKAKKNDIEVHARSAFLQGLFFLPRDAFSSRFTSAKEHIDKLDAISSDCNIPVAALCLCFALINPCIDKVVIGVDSQKQLIDNLGFLKNYMDKVADISRSLESLNLNDEDIILPYRWK